MIFLKDGVKVQGIRPELLLAVIVAHATYQNRGHHLTLTSFDDGVHSPTSLHYSGNAVDLRTFNVGSDADILSHEIDDALGQDYDVVLEEDHIHIEYQPRR